MDNVTHSLTGLALARAGLNRAVPGAVLLLLLSANAPDIDIAALTRGSFRYFEAHRGYSHSLIGLPVLAAVCVVVSAVLLRRKLPWTRAYIVCTIGVASHLLLDWTNSYGVRLLLPFSSRWSHLDLNGLYDAWILAVLAFAAVWPWFARLVSREIGEKPASGRGTALAALVFFLLFDVSRTLLHAKAVDQLQARLYDGAPALQAAALPDSFSPLRWRGVVETVRTFRALDVSIGTPLDIESAQVFYKPSITPQLAELNRLQPFRYFLYFARFPVWSQQPAPLQNGIGRRYDLTDLRFGTPEAGAFHCIALMNQSGALLVNEFTFGSGRELGWTDR
jgi:inner membrane protein